MRYIDAYNHFFPKRYYEALLETPAFQQQAAAAMAQAITQFLTGSTG